MKKMVGLMTVLIGLAACDNSGTITINKDSLTKKAENVVDSVKSKGSRLIDTLQNKLDNKKDSLEIDTAR